MTIFFIGCALLWNCSDVKKNHEEVTVPIENPVNRLNVDTIEKHKPNPLMPSPRALEQRMIDAGLVNIKENAPGILVDLKYSSADNFSGIDLYGDLDHCYLQRVPAEMLAQAQNYLKENFPDHSLLVYDCTRPLHIQQVLWDTLDMPPNKKKQYVADPKIGSIHNFGSAVDLTIALQDGTPLDMGTPYDYFGELSYPSKEAEMLEKKLLTVQQIKNRILLRDVMLKAGFTPIKYEWWHFNAMSRSKAKEKYAIIE